MLWEIRCRCLHIYFEIILFGTSSADGAVFIYFRNRGQK
ncbi:hypothetical protein BURPS1655_B0010 [Burkholderia pseudomallei 1655]|nr:hypothetical protein BURPS1655_B0010 [Burkholderia pseudomallei 1655]